MTSDSSGERGPSTVDEGIAASLVTDFSEASLSLFSAGGLDDLLSRVVGLAIEIFEACDVASVVLVDNGVVTANVNSANLTSDLNAIQRDNRDSPVRDALTSGVSVYVDELVGDARWPTFVAAAAHGGLRSVLCLPMSSPTAHGALSLYSRYPQAFGVVDRARGLLLATLVAIAADVAQTHADDERRAHNLVEALSTRELIGQAQGILIERERISADQAFVVLREASQHLNVKLRDVAQHLVETGERPDTGPPRSNPSPQTP